MKIPQLTQILLHHQKLAVETVIEVEEKNEILPAPLEIPAYKEDEIADISGNN